MRVTICEFGPRDGEIIEIPDDSTHYKMVKPLPVFTAWQSIDPPYEVRQVDDSLRRNPRFNDPFGTQPRPTMEVKVYSVQEYARPQEHSTRFALVSPEFYAWTLNRGAPPA